MEKSWLIGRMESLLAVREYNYDGSWLDIELGFPLYDVSTALEENPEYFTDSEVKDLFNKAMVAVKELVQNNIDNLFLLKTSLAPGRDLFPNKEKHWWWYIPDKLMNEEQLKEWKKYLKKDGYK